ncbi:hypothetical protein [Deinococcus aquaedulcis]|uniref:hypothetical protein n=1 Tax=Deinococcus aquaedulcis TaxID=2840455 RepID=UPI001C833819|nr:hypothetical protein [Deinococcus aquaedulcis]
MKVVAALGLATLLSPLAQAQTLVPFSDPQLPFTVSLPKGWLGADFQDGTSGVSLVSAKAPPATMIRLLFTPKNGTSPTPAGEFQKFEAGIKGTGATPKQTSSRAVSYGGVSGVERQYAVTHPKGQLTMRVWYGVGAKNLYSFQMTDTPARFAQASALFSKVLASVRFKR